MAIIFLLFRNPKKNTLTIIFHAILSKNFNFDDGKKIVIRGEEPVFTGGWKESNVPVLIERLVPKYNDIS